MRAAHLCAAGLLLVAVSASAATKPCPALIGVAANGNFYEDRGGTWVRQSPKVIEEVLRAGCYPEGGPSPTSSVTLKVASHAPVARVQRMYDLLARSGWPKEKVTTEVWFDAPRRPVR